MSAGADEDISGYEKKQSWDIAVRHKDLQRLLSVPEKEKKRLKKRAIEGVIERARAVLGSVIRPEKAAMLDYQDFRANRERGELDVLATLEEALSRGQKINADVLDYETLRFDSRVEKNTPIVLVMDASLSMNGEKVALLAVAAAVVALCVPSTELCLVSFSSLARVVKRFDEELSVEKIVERVLEMPTIGLTNLEAALKEALRVQDEHARGNTNVILISDGKYTEGRDPSYLAPRFRRLHALKLGRDIAGRALLLDLIKNSAGQFFEVRRMHELPRTMYGAMKVLLR